MPKATRAYGGFRHIIRHVQDRPAVVVEALFFTCVRGCAAWVEAAGSGAAHHAALRAQGCILTCALDGTVKVWQFVPDATREKGALVDTTPVYVHPPEDEGAPGRNTQACAHGLRSA